MNVAPQMSAMKSFSSIGNLPSDMLQEHLMKNYDCHGAKYDCVVTSPSYIHRMAVVLQ